MVARTSAFFFKNRPSDIREIAKHLGVDLLLEGSVRRSGSRLRVTAQLINAADGCHLWSDRYDREMDMQDVLAVQDEIAKPCWSPSSPICAGVDKIPILKHKTDNAAAHEMYLKGRFHLFRMTQSGIDAGVQYFKRAIEQDPSYALAYVGLAHAQRVHALSLEMSPATSVQREKRRRSGPSRSTPGWQRRMLSSLSTFTGSSGTGRRLRSISPAR